MEFEHAYDEPRNEDLIRRIYAYADWCSEHAKQCRRRGGRPLDLRGRLFLPTIPTRRAPRLDMPRWFSRDDIVLMKDLFSYHLNPDDYERLLELFPDPRQRRRREK